MGFGEEEIFKWFAGYAYQPLAVYATVVVLMVASSFGLPVPEEVTLVGAGLVGYASTRPDLSMPPYPGAPTVHIELLATICFLAVFLSDFLVYTLGSKLGPRFLDSRLMKPYRSQMDKVSSWVKKYGAWAAGLFRFTPGLRFPGHFSCGMLGLARWKFVAVDGLAALVSVPTQVLLVAYYGETIMDSFKQFKAVIFGILLVVFLVWLFKRLQARRLVNSAGES